VVILASVVGQVASIVGAAVKICEIIDYIPKINTKGG